MNDALQPQELVVTVFGSYVRPHDGAVWSGGLVQLLGELGFSDASARAALTRLVKRELLARERSGRLVHYRATPRCTRLLIEGDGRIFKLGERRTDDVDGWTVLWHQIPEERRLERSRLARRLRFLGFGPVQDSVWVSPHDHCAEVGELLVELGVAQFSTVFVARLGVRDGLDAMVARAWDLTGLVDRYDAFVGEFGPYLRRGSALGDREAFRVRTRLVHLFRGFPPVDPELPEELAPLSGARSRAVETFHILYDELAASSQRHFDAVTGAHPSG